MLWWLFVGWRVTHSEREWTVASFAVKEEDGGATDWEGKGRRRLRVVLSSSFAFLCEGNGDFD